MLQSRHTAAEFKNKNPQDPCNMLAACKKLNSDLKTHTSEYT